MLGGAGGASCVMYDLNYDYVCDSILVLGVGSRLDSGLTNDRLYRRARRVNTSP